MIVNPGIRRVQGRISKYLSFNAPLLTTIAAGGKGSTTPTYTRATTAYVMDHDGVFRNVLSGEARFVGARRVRNILTFSQLYSNAIWTKQDCTTAVTAIVTAPDGTGTAFKQISNNGFVGYTGVNLTSTAGKTYIFSCYVRKAEITSFILVAQAAYWADAIGRSYSFNLATGTVSPGTGSGHTGGIVNIGDGWYRCWMGFTPDQSVTSALQQRQPGTGDGASGFYIWGSQVEDVTGQSTQTVGEYVSTNVLSAPYHGANVDGVKYFQTNLNGTGIDNATLRGYLSELAATQLVTPTAAIKDMTGTWAKGATLTIAKTATDTLGNANACSVLTGGAVAATNTATLTLVAAASSRTYSCYIKRITGTGPILITQDNFATSTDVSSSLVANTWVLVQLNKSQLNAVYGLQVSTNGDVIHVDWNQFEAGNTATSPIDAAGGTRNADALTYPTTSNIDFTQGTYYAELASLLPTGQTAVGALVVVGITGGNNFPLLVYPAALNTSIGSNDGTNFPQKTGITSMFTAIRKRASSWGSGQSVTGDGAAPATSAFDGSMGSAGNIGVGCAANGSLQWNGTIKNVRIYSSQLTNATLQALTLL